MSKGNPVESSNALESVNNLVKSNTEKLKETERFKKAEFQIKEKWRKKNLKSEEEFNEKVAKDAEKWLNKVQKDDYYARDLQLRQAIQDSVGFTNKMSLVSQKFINDLSQSAKQFASSLGNSVGQLAGKITSGANDFIGNYSNYLSGISTRLQGLGTNYNTLLDTMSTRVGASPYIKQTALLENLNKLVAQGIAQNLEERAFLATVSDRIATTFNAFDSSMLRLIRIQQQDSTAARLGMEAQLTSLLNSRFGDTSYLSDTASSIRSALLGSQSLMSTGESLAFESTVQSWLGALGSVGVSESTLQSLATGINALGTGDISTLSGNSALQNLLVLAGNQAGLSYSDMLTKGITPQQTSQLLSSVVSFAQSIARENNKVLLAQYATLFNMNVSDLQAMLNITADDLTALSQSGSTYSSMVNTLESQLSTIGSRMSVKDKIDTAFANIQAGIGETIATNVAAYTTWSIANFLDQTVGGISIPIAIPMTGIYKTSVSDIMKTGIVGASVIGKFSKIFGNLTSSGLSYSDWSSNTGFTRGTGFDTSNLGTSVTSTTSQSGYQGNTDSSALYKDTLTSASEQTAQTISDATTESTEDNTKKLVEYTESIQDYSNRIYNLLLNAVDVSTNGFKVHLDYTI